MTTLERTTASLANPTPREVALAAAKAAAQVLRRGFGQTQQISYKGPVDLVTERDRQSERRISGIIRSAFPEHAILGEEAGRSGESPCRWVVDPLDGTTNYAHGYPMFAVSIAYEEHGQLRVGVIIDPIRRETFVAERGQGVTLNGKPIRVSETATLITSLLETGFPYRRERLPVALRQFDRLAYQTQGLRRSGSAALGLAYVAAGRLDGFWEATLSPWDMAAGALMIEEAGGVVTQTDGAPFQIDSTNIAAANPAIHPALVEQLRLTETASS